MADHPHTIDRWDDATGENLIEQIAGVSDHQVGKIGHDLVSKKHDGCRQDDGYRYCDNVNAVRWVGHSLEVATSFKWVVGAPGRGC